MSILKHHDSAMLGNQHSNVVDPERRFSASMEMRPPPLQVTNTSGTPLDSTEDIAFSPSEIDPNLLLFTNTIFFDTNLGRYLDQFEDFPGYEDEGYDVDPTTVEESHMNSEDLDHDTGYLPRSDAGFGGGREFVDHRPPLLENSHSSADLIGNITSPNSTASNTALHPPASSSSSKSTTVSTTPVSTSHRRATIAAFPDYASNPVLDPQRVPSSSTSKSAAMPQSLPLSTFIGAFDETPTPSHNAATHELSPTSTSSSSTSSHHNHLQYPHLEQHGSISSPLNEDEAERLRRLAAEEDKRRRNTAASARFRIKKKQRDQELERRAREQAERVSELEKKIAQLELENKWLRNLLVEKKS